jgi:hypothetical protein
MLRSRATRVIWNSAATDEISGSRPELKRSRDPLGGARDESLGSDQADLRILQGGKKTANGDVSVLSLFRPLR